jgi:diaminopimelate decarboxylase
MNDLMRPALYNAIHKILPATKSKKYQKKLMNLLDQYVKVQINF